MNDTFLLHQCQQSTRDMAFVFNVTGIDTKGSAYIGVPQTACWSVLQQRVHRGL